MKYSLPPLIISFVIIVGCKDRSDPSVKWRDFPRDILEQVFQLTEIDDSRLETSHSYILNRRFNPIDSFYNQLKISGADSILLYHELRDSETKGLVSWKTDDILSGIIFEVISGKIYETKLNNAQELKLKETRTLYFTNEKTILDTLPPFPWQSTNVFDINIRSFRIGSERNFIFSCDQIYFGTFLISKVGIKSSDIVLGF